MIRVRVVTDSTADMDEAEAARLGVTMVPLTVHWEGASYRDGIDISADEFYRKLRDEKGTPKTSQPPVGQFEEVYRGLLEESEAVVSIHLTGHLSGTANAALLAGRNVAPDRITVVDSNNIATSLGWIVLRTARLAAEGGSHAECAAMAADLARRASLFCVFDTLEFLRRGGRIGRVQAVAGSLLSLKPMIQLVKGEIIPVDRVRTRSNAVRRTVELLRALGPLEQIAVVYADNPEPAEQMMLLLKEAYPGLPIETGRIGPVVGTHVGPGAFGACYVLAAGAQEVGAK